MSLPKFPEGFSADFLNLTLSEKFLPPGISIQEVSTEPLAEGTGMMADISKLTLKYNTEPSHLPLSVIAKYASENSTNREVAMNMNLYERETRFADELDPQTDARCPAFYFCALDGDNFLILMEDLSDYEVGDQAIGANLEQTELAIDELAKLHSAFWDKTSTLKWVPGIAKSYHADNMRNWSRTGWDPMVKAFGEFVPESVRDHRDRFLESVPALQLERMSGPNTLCHGDFRMPNLLFGVDPGHHPLAILDWQGPLIAKGMFDVALLLGQNTKTEIRQKEEKQLLDRYREGLKKHGVEGLTSKFIWDDYRRCILYNWVYAAVVAGTLDPTNEAGEAWMGQMVARQSSASEDLEVFDLLPS
ncbi:MAG: phosphotransferase [Pseudomonadota bacterium]|nr:phosphotransferase [Pseudomonadota bacterium]